MKQLASLQQEQDALQQDYKEQKEMMSRWVCTPGTSPCPIKAPLNTPSPSLGVIPLSPHGLSPSIPWRQADQGAGCSAAGAPGAAGSSRVPGGKSQGAQHVARCHMSPLVGGSRPAEPAALGADSPHVGLHAQ